MNKWMMVLLLSLMVPASLWASGSSGSRSGGGSSRPSSGGSSGGVQSGGNSGGTVSFTRVTDRATYHKGKKIFNIQALPDMLVAKDDPLVAAQRKALLAIRSQLPASKQKNKHLENLAGRISEDQLAALKYYVAHRY